MVVDIHINDSYPLKNVMSNTKSIDPGPSAQFSQADLGQNFLLLIDFLHIEGPYYLMSKVGCSD